MDEWMRRELAPVAIKPYRAEPQQLPVTIDPKLVKKVIENDKRRFVSNKQNGRPRGTNGKYVKT
jgi:hypothetical protein